MAAGTRTSLSSRPFQPGPAVRHPGRGCRPRRWPGALALLLALAAPTRSPAADLTDTERRWLQGMAPVIDHAQSVRLPLDIVVQPQPAAGLPPLAMAFVAGRCKLVLSLRGNPLAQAALARLEPALHDAALELMAAHELGHCQRHLQGAWTALPAGFSAPTAPAGLAPALLADLARMRAVQREEGFGDLVGLAWTRQRHPGLYAPLYRWLLDERSHQRIPGSHHDTLPWLRLAPEASAFGGAASIFAEAERLWAQGLSQSE